jgi:hypothetical protein
MQPNLLDELVKRYEAGERSPDLVQALNSAAWVGFHDPWEAPPQQTPNPTRKEEDVADEPMDENTDDMEAIRPLSVDMIERFLRWKGWNHWKHSDGTRMVNFRYDPISDRETLLRFMIQGKNLNVFQMSWSSDRRVSAERFDQAFRLCNEWNDHKRWPRAYVEMPRAAKNEDETEDKEVTSGTLVLDLQFLVHKGIQQELFNEMVRDAIATGWDFWKNAYTEYGL